MDKIADGIDCAASLPQLHSLFEDAVGRFGFECFVGGCVRDGGRPADVFLLRWPGAWAEHPQGDVSESSLVATAVQSSDSFTWDEYVARRTSEQVRAFVIAEAFGWRAGLVVPVHGPGDERGLVALAARRLRMTPEDRIWVERTCHSAYRRGRFLRGADAPRLSGREGEALTLVARGYDDEEIAGALRITKATAHAHVERAKRRLGARSRSHAVAIAMERRLI